jgi:hypothetical protein
MSGALVPCKIDGDRHYPDVLQNPTKYHNFNPEFIGMLNYKKNAALPGLTTRLSGPAPSWSFHFFCISQPQVFPAIYHLSSSLTRDSFA